MKTRTGKKGMIAAMSLAMALGATGCFGKKTEEALQAQVQVEPKDALLLSLDAHMSRTVSAMNQVFFQGDFMKAVNSTPMEGIPLQSEQLHRGLDYLLSNASKNGNVVTYRPDARLCTEVLAPNDPAACVQVIAPLMLVQSITSDTAGMLSFFYGQANPLNVVYDENQIALSSDLAQVRAAAIAINDVMVAQGMEGIPEIPSTAEGSAIFQIVKSGTGFLAQATITQPVHIVATSNGKPMDIAIASSPNPAQILMDPSSGLLVVSGSIPAATADFWVNDSQSALHEVKVNFPGISGSAQLLNPAKQIAIQALQLVGGEFSIDVDGAQTLKAVIGTLTGKLTVTDTALVADVLSQFDAQVQISGVNQGILYGQGTAALSIAQGSSFNLPFASGPVKMLAGSAALTGTGDFQMSLNIQANACFQGTDNGGAPLQIAACTY